jgi:hypothetical protein
MEKFVQIVTVAAAGSFVGTAAVLFGEVWGLQHAELIALWTFGDIVNAAAPMVLQYGWAVICYAYLQYRARQMTTWWRYPAQLVLMLPFFLVALFVKRPNTLDFAMTALVMLNLSAMFQDQLVEFFGGKVWLWIDTGFAAIFACLLLGYLSGTGALRDDKGIAINSATDPQCGEAGLALERGMVLINGPKYSVVPWASIVSTENRKKIKNPAEPTAFADSCFGWEDYEQTEK